MQRIPNYGSFLQSFALKKLMEQRGHTVTYVDIERKKGHCPPKKSKLQQKLEKLKYVDKYFFRRMKDSEKNKLDELLNRLGTDSHKVSNPDMLEKILDIKYDYASFNAFVESERDHALGYFEKAGL